MAKTKLEKHLEELGENTSGGAHDAVTFSGAGLNFLKNLFKGAKQEPLEKGNFEDVDPEDMELDEMEDFIDDNDVEGAPEQGEDESDERYEKRVRRFLKKWLRAQAKAKKTAKNANGGELEEEDDEDLEDPANDTKGSILTNKGERIKKNANGFDERRFVKNIEGIEEEFGDVLDASPALGELAKSIRYLGKGMNQNTVQVAEIAEQNILLAKAVGELLKSNAALAADIELIKKQPVTAPASGLFASFAKNSGNNNGGDQRRLSKSDIQDSLTDLLNKGEITHETLSQLDFCRNDHELREFVESLPQNIQNQL